MRSRWISLAACMGLAACIDPVPLKPQSLPPYPAPIADFAQWDKFPADCGGYHRGKVTAFGPGLSNYSVAYDRFDDALQSAVTLYFYPLSGDLPAQQRAEEDRMLKAHARPRVVERRALVLERQGATLNTMLLTFEYEELFAGKQQRLSSQLWLGFQKTSTFKVRSTVPVAQAAAAESAVRELLQCVAWAEQ